MKTKVVVTFVVIAIMGVLSHFAYDYFNIELLKIIFPANESLFEHTKLIIFPTLIYMIFDYIITKDKENILSSYLAGIIVSVVFMISGFYTIYGIIGYNIDWINILLFFICVAIVVYYRYKKITLFDGANNVIALIILLIIIEIFSFYPADIAFFKELNT